VSVKLSKNSLGGNITPMRAIELVSSLSPSVHAMKVLFNILVNANDAAWLKI